MRIRRLSFVCRFLQLLNKKEPVKPKLRYVKDDNIGNLVNLLI